MTEKPKYDLCGAIDPSAQPHLHFCTLPKGHGGDWHIATIGPAEWGEKKAPELSRWPMSPPEEVQ